MTNYIIFIAFSYILLLIIFFRDIRKGRLSVVLPLKQRKRLMYSFPVILLLLNLLFIYGIIYFKLPEVIERMSLVHGFVLIVIVFALINITVFLFAGSNKRLLHTTLTLTIVAIVPTAVFLFTYKILHPLIIAVLVLICSIAGIIAIFRSLYKLHKKMNSK